MPYNQLFINHNMAKYIYMLYMCYIIDTSTILVVVSKHRGTAACHVATLLPRDAPGLAGGDGARRCWNFSPR